MVNIPLTILHNDDGTYTVLSNVFNIVTEWNTLEEAIRNWQEALSCHIEGLSKDDEEYQTYIWLKDCVNTYVTV